MEQKDERKKAFLPLTSQLGAGDVPISGNQHSRAHGPRDRPGLSPGLMCNHYNLTNSRKTSGVNGSVFST